MPSWWNEKNGVEKQEELSMDWDAFKETSLHVSALRHKMDCRSSCHGADVVVVVVGKLRVEFIRRPTTGGVS